MVKSNVTISDVARRARVSVATVSRTLHAETQHLVAPETLHKVNRIIAQCFYTPNTAARSLRQAAYKTIGVIVPPAPGIFLTDYYCQILAGVADALLGHADYRFQLVMLPPVDAAGSRARCEALAGVDGLIVVHWRAFFADNSVFEKLRIPCVLISEPEPDVHAYTISGDHRHGGRLAAQYLYERGHRHMAVMTGPPWSVDSRLRVEGFLDYLTQQGVTIEAQRMLRGDFQEERAAAAANAFLHTNRSPVTAFFCCNDNMALGVLAALTRRGLRCPADISVIGYDDDRRAALADPPLTTIRVPLYDIAKSGTNHLLRYLAGEDRRGFFFQEIVRPVTLVERQSVRPIVAN